MNAKKDNAKKRIKQTAAQNRRYRIHQKLKGSFELYAKKKLIIVPFDVIIENPLVIELRDKFRYSIQFSLISENDATVKELK